MNLFDTTQIGLERAISGSAMRHSVLAGNIANANTPGYARRDVDFHGALRTAMARGDDLNSVGFSPQVDSGAVLRAELTRLGTGRTTVRGYAPVAVAAHRVELAG